VIVWVVAVQASVCIKITALCPIALLEKASDLLRWQKKHPSFSLPWKTHSFPVLSDSSPLHLTASEPAALTAEEERELQLAHSRLLAVCARCAEHGIPLLVDAEYATVQPAIDYFTLVGALAFNDAGAADGGRPIVHGTIQAYLRDARDRLEAMVLGAERERVRLGLKVVRGAYLTREARLAAALGVPSPVHGSIQETHDCYNGCAAFLLDRVRRGSASVMLATHNVESGSWLPAPQTPRLVFLHNWLLMGYGGRVFLADPTRPTRGGACPGAGDPQGRPQPAIRAADGHGGRAVAEPPQRRVPGQQVPAVRAGGADHPLPHQARRGEQGPPLRLLLRQAAAPVRPAEYVNQSSIDMRTVI
jgi:hypothetical protein